jgi:CheY-specific phosphatase CheX
MDTAHTNATIVSYLEVSSIELLRDIGVEFGAAAPSDWLPDTAAIIGFAGDGIAGSLALSTSHSCLTELAKIGNAQMIEDWLGELSNQLLGRVKRRFAPHGASFSLGTPVVITGDHLRLTRSMKVKNTLTVSLEAPIGRVEVWIEVEFRGGFEFSEQTHDDGSLIEGEALLF